MTDAHTASANRWFSKAARTCLRSDALTAPAPAVSVAPVNGFKYPCPSCGHSIHVEETRCVACGRDAPGPPGEPKSDTDRNELPKKEGWFPTGLVIALAIYGAGAFVFLEVDKRTSPEYAAAHLMVKAEKLLEPDEGISVPPENLAKAMELYLEATVLVEDVGPFWDRLELIGRRFHDRKLPVPPELERRFAFLATGRRNRLAADQTGLLVSKPQDRWDFGKITELRQGGRRFLLLGAALIFVVYGWWWWQRRRAGNQKIAYSDRGPSGGR